MTGKLIVLWAHPRSRSTAFERMIIERGDFYVMHEPFCTLYDTSLLKISYKGQNLEFHGYDQLIDWILIESLSSAIFIKETCEYTYSEVLAREDFLRCAQHTIIFREIKETIDSHFAINPYVKEKEIGYENLLEIIDLHRNIKGMGPYLIGSEDLIERASDLIRKFCEAVSIPFLDEALHWEAKEIKIWERSKKWHARAQNSTGFASSKSAYSFNEIEQKRIIDLYNANLSHYNRILNYYKNNSHEYCG